MPKKTTVGSIFIKDVPWHRTEEKLPSPLGTPEYERQCQTLNEIDAEVRRMIRDALPSPKQKGPPKQA